MSKINDTDKQRIRVAQKIVNNILIMTGETDICKDGSGFYKLLLDETLQAIYEYERDYVREYDPSLWTVVDGKQG